MYILKIMYKNADLYIQLYIFTKYKKYYSRTLGEMNVCCKLSLINCATLPLSSLTRNKKVYLSLLRKNVIVLCDTFLTANYVCRAKCNLKGQSHEIRSG